jgi:hypothetical protein
MDRIAEDSTLQAGQVDLVTESIAPDYWICSIEYTL